MHIDGAIEPFAVLPTDSIEQLAPCEHTTRVTSQCGQQLEFGCRQIERVPSSRSSHPLDVKREIANFQHLSIWTCGRSPEHGLHAGDKLARTERFRHVVVGADVEAVHAIGLFDPCCQHDDWNGGFGPQPSCDVETVHPRQAEIEHHQIGTARRGENQRVFASPRSQHVEPRVAQVVADYVRDPRVILDDQNRLQAFPPSAARGPADAIRQTSAARRSTPGGRTRSASVAPRRTPSPGRTTAE